MATTLPPSEPSVSSQDDSGAAGDSYPLGWRYGRGSHAGEPTTWTLIPLTLDDVCHPQEGDQVAFSEAHQRRRRYLCGVFEMCLANDPQAVVLDNVRIEWGIADLQPHSPDVVVIKGIRERHDWTVFDVVTEGVRPSLIVEITSPATASVDRSHKLEEYELAAVPFYVIVDGVHHRNQPTLRLLGYEWTADGYRVLVPNEHGHLWLEPVGVWLGVIDNEIICLDRDGSPLGDPHRLASALSMAGQVLNAVSQGLSTATLGLGVATEGMAEALRARAEAEQRAIEAEARLKEAEQRIRDLESELWSTRGVD